jgi:hypothetical protein
MSPSTLGRYRDAAVTFFLLATACGARTGLDWADGTSLAAATDGGASSVDGGTTGPSTDAASRPDATPTLDATACLAGGNVWHVDAWYSAPAKTLVPAGLLHAAVSDPLPPVEVRIEYDAPDQDDCFELTIAGEADQAGVPVTPLHLGLYQRAERADFQVRGFPGLDVSQGTGGCNRVFGSFDVSALVVNEQFVEELTVAFELSCDGSLPETGCLHVEHVPVE